MVTYRMGQRQCLKVPVEVSEFVTGSPVGGAPYLVGTLCPRNGYDLSGPPPE